MRWLPERTPPPIDLPTLTGADAQRDRRAVGAAGDEGVRNERRDALLATRAVRYPLVQQAHGLLTSCRRRACVGCRPRRSRK